MAFVAQSQLNNVCEKFNQEVQQLNDWGAFLDNFMIKKLS